MQRCEEVELLRGRCAPIHSRNFISPGMDCIKAPTLLLDGAATGVIGAVDAASAEGGGGGGEGGADAAAEVGQGKMLPKKLLGNVGVCSSSLCDLIIAASSTVVILLNFVPVIIEGRSRIIACLHNVRYRTLARCQVRRW
jgi:hypothetical protein